MNNETEYSRKIIFRQRLQEIVNGIQLHLDTFETDAVFSKPKEDILDKKSNAELNFSRIGKNNV
jgi:hypothetical protein